MIEDNGRQYQVGKNCEKAFRFINDSFTDEQKNRIRKYLEYSKATRNDRLTLTHISPYLNTEELEELETISDQLPNLTSSDVAIKLKRLTAIEGAKSRRLNKSVKVKTLPFEHAYRRLLNE